MGSNSFVVTSQLCPFLYSNMILHCVSSSPKHGATYIIAPYNPCLFSI